MEHLLSRVIVAVVGVPLVLGFVWLGGWWLFTLAATGAVLALHEYAGLVRPLRPLVLATYVGAVLALVGAERGGVDWLLGGIAATFALAFVLHGLASTRAPATASIGSTILGASWIGIGLGCLLLVRRIPEHAQLAALTIVLAVWAGDIAAYFMGRFVGRHKLAPTLSPGKTWEGFLAGTIATVFV